MTLDLNETIEPYREGYGSGVVEIPKLVSGKDKKGRVVDVPRVLLSGAHLMNRRLVSSKTQAWNDNYFFLGDAFAYNEDATKFKVVLDAELLREVNADTRLVEGAILLVDGMYDTLPGEEFVREQVKKYLGDQNPKDQKTNPIWLAIARGDKTLLAEYVDKKSPEMKEHFNYDKVMGIFVQDNLGKGAILRPAIVFGLESRSQLDGGGRVGGDGARWVGVAPEALSAPGIAIQRPNLETSLSVVNEYLGNSGLQLRVQ